LGNEVRIRASTKDDASRGLDNIRDKFDRLQRQGAKGFGIGVGAAVTAKGLSLMDRALSSTIDFLGDSVSKASNLNETLAKSGKVFGDHADEIEEWGGTAAKTMGLSKQAAIAAAAGFGDLFNKMDETKGGSLEMSKGLVQLSSDLASFHNLAGGSEEALEKLRSGLAGETEPLRSLGVFLNEAKVQAKAASLGFEEVNGKFTEGAKIAARYALIMEETASAHGDFADTADDLANAQRAAAAAMDDAQAELGQKLIPVMTEATKKGVVLIDTIVNLSNALDEVSAPRDFLDTDEDVADLMAMREEVDANGEQFKWLQDLISGRDPFDSDEDVDALRRGGDGVDYYTGRLYNSVEASDLAEARADDLGDSILDVGSKAMEASDRVADSLENVIENFDTAKSELERLGQGAADAIYDPMIAKGKLAIVESDIVKERAIANSTKRKLAEIDDLEASGKISAKEAKKRRAELKETARQSKVRLAELNKDRIGLIAELKAYGKLSSKEQTKFIQDLLKKWRAATGAQKAQIAALIAQMARLDEAVRQTYQDYQRLGGGEQGGPSRRAGGGPVDAKMPYLVGEEGPELFVPKAAGNIIPTGQTSRMLSGGGAGMTSGGGMTLQVTVNAAPGMTPGAAREIGEAFGPAIYKWMRDTKKVA
jgi:polyhydroxyalkanoate synthesis regulator phasin